jgi:L-glutamine---4-(methylsulfanyl)-2-oxobutanoate aminotransferase
LIVLSFRVSLPIAHRLAPFGTSIFATMSRLALEHSAVNLSQGFPDFDGPAFIKDAAIHAIGTQGTEGHNQYARMMGVPALNQAIAAAWATRTGQSIDPDACVTVTTGCTQALPSAILGLINPGDEVVVFEPFYDSYRAVISMAGATPKYVRLRPQPSGEFAFDEAELRSAYTNKTRAILLNTPHNPTGKVFSRPELELIARLCIDHDVIAITDEVYERLVYEPDQPHIHLATLPGMAERTITLSSLGKTFSLTGWKIGWAIAPPALSKGVRAAHQFLTFGAATPLQHAAALAIQDGDAYIRELVGHYTLMRDHLAGALQSQGFRVFKPAATYFIMADWSGVRDRLVRRHPEIALDDDVAFAEFLVREVKVAAIPPSSFYADPLAGRSLVRFAFCKKRKTIEDGIARLERGLSR